MRKKLKNKIIKFFGTMIIVALGCVLVVQILPTPPLVTFFNVGQGDAALVQDGSGHTILIDGGPDNTIMQELPRKLPWGQHSLDVVILSHSHSDHLAGLVSVLKKYKIKKIIMPRLVNTNGLYKTFINEIKNKNIEAVYPVAGQHYVISQSLSFDILSTGLPEVSEDDINSSSLVTKIKNNNHEFIFTGDATPGIENQLIGSSFDLSAEVLKVAHHGSGMASNLVFLQKVKPAWAIISVGRNNNYGLPSTETLRRLQSLSIKIKRTDIDGEVDIIPNGPGLSVENHRQIFLWKAVYYWLGLGSWLDGYVNTF